MEPTETPTLDPRQPNVGRRRLLMIALATTLAAILIGVVLVRGGAAKGWQCEERLFIHGEAQLSAGDGERTLEDAKVRAASILVNLAPDWPLGEAATRAALSSTAGQTRYDAQSGHLYVDGVLTVRVPIERESHGAFTVGTIESCPPSR